MLRMEFLVLRLQIKTEKSKKDRVRETDRNKKGDEEEEEGKKQRENVCNWFIVDNFFFAFFFLKKGSTLFPWRMEKILSL